MKRFRAIIMVLSLWIFIPNAKAFVLMGPLSTNETATTFNYTGDFGSPKEIDNRRGIKRFYRWNVPHFVYSFDASFINYFGLEGVEAVHEAFGVLNDFFVNEEYDGVSELDLAKHGFSSNFNTSWINTTAQNAQIIDIKSLALGMLVDRLGIGNPYRWAYSITGTSTNILNSQIRFETRLRNYDPITQQPTDVINNVKYSYRLVHDAANIALGQNTLPTFTTADMEEFTTDASGNAWSSVTAITDAFYGNTRLWWTDTPSLFNFGVYYDGMNAMGGQYKPRHALTYDDAGGLKYLYSTNNFIFEDLPGTVLGIEPAQYLPDHLAPYWPDPSGRSLPIFPRRGGTFTTPSGTMTTTFTNFHGGFGNPTGIMGVAMRGGIDKLQFHHVPFDSLLGLNFIATNFTWTDTFIYQYNNFDTVNISDASGRVIGTIDNTQRGIQWLNPNADVTGLSIWQQPTLSASSRKFLTQKVGRNVGVPDYIFSASALPAAADGVPVGWQRPANTYQSTATNYYGTAIPAGSNTNGPGIILPSATSQQFVFNNTFFQDEVFEVIWSGEASVVGHQKYVASLWGWIRGPGPNDFITFPQDNIPWIIENSLVPDVAPPTITMVSENGGVTPIDENSLTRTEEVLTLIGNDLASVTAIEIMSGDLVLQTIMPADKYVISDQRIDIPVGILSEVVEGAARTVRVWNSVGASEAGPQKFGITTGKPFLYGTDYDNAIFDRRQSITIQGYGFKSKTAGETQLAYFRVDDSTGAALDDDGTAGGGASNGLPRAATFEVISDRLAVLPINSINPNADGFNRRLRVARKTVANAADLGNVLSPGTNPMFTAITTKPVVTTLTQLESTGTTWTTVTGNGAFRRDLVLEINGTGLNTASVIEVVQENGGSFANPVFIQLPNAAVAVEDNGTRMQISANAIPYSDADNNTTAKRSFKIYNAVDNTDLNASQMFAVNTQPVFDAIGAFSTAGYFNRDKTVGDDITIFGSGLKAVSQVVFADHDNVNADTLSISLPSPGITVADNQIAIDTSTFQIGNATDTDVNSSYRILKLTSARSNATLPLAQRFYVGAPPILTALSGIGVEGNYTRDSETITLEGSGFGHATSLEIVDAQGNLITGIPGLISGIDGTGGTGLTINNATGITVSPNPTGWVNVGYLLDNAVSLSRRVKLTTPFGTVVSSTTAGTGAFTVSATPEFMGSIQATFAGGGYTADDTADATDTNGTYDRSEGDLVINGKNFRGLTTIEFYSGAGVSDGNFTIDPLNPPAGIAMNPDGTQIVIASTTVPTAWTGGGTNNNATVNLVSVAGQSTGNSTISSTVTPIQAQD